MNSRALAAAALMVLSFAASAAPLTIDFEHVAGAGSAMVPITPYVEDGFRLTNLQGGGTDGIFDAAWGGNTNGSDIFGWCGACNTNQTIHLQRAGGGVFSLVSFDSALLSRASGGNTLSVIGYLAGGGTLTTAVTQTSTWVTQVLNFNNVTAVDFAFGAGHNGLDHAFDNLQVVTGSVPEPGSLVLAGLALFGLVLARRRA